MQRSSEGEHSATGHPNAPINGAADTAASAPGSGVIEDDFTPINYGRRFVLTVITTTVIVTVVAISLIYHRWLVVSEPTSAIVVEGDDSLGPTKLRIRSADPENPVVLPPDLTPDNKFVTPVLLHPGIYLLTASVGDHVVAQIPFKIEPHRGIHFRLPSPTTRKEAEEKAKGA